MDLAGRLGVVGRSGLPDRALRAEQLRLIAARVPFDGHVFAMTDPVTAVVNSPHAYVPMVSQSDLPGLIRRRYAVGVGSEWRTVLAEFGVNDAVSVTFDDRWGTWGFLELWRSAGRFSEVERRQVAELSPAITTSLRSSVAHTFTVPDPHLTGLDSGVVLLDRDLEVRSVSSGAAQALMQLLPPAELVPPVPAAAYNVAAALLANAAGRWLGEPWSRVHLGGNRWATVRAEPLDGRVVVHIGPSTTPERVDLFARSNRLSPRETEVLRLALHGMDTHAMADELLIAHTTTEDHLKALLAKTGSTSRHQLLSRALGG